MRHLLFAILALLAFSTENAIARPSPSEVPIVRNPRQASALLLEINHPWEDFFMSGPIMLALLTQLMVISSKEDFSLRESVPLDGFRYMRHPESFHASLLQLSNDGRETFVNVHRNMGKIQQYMQKVPIQVKTAIVILTQSSPEMIKLLLPIALNQIQDYVRTCVQLSAESQSKFTSSTLLMNEILQATVSSRAKYEEKLARVQVELNVTATQKKNMENLGELLKQQQKMLDDEVAKLRSKYDSLSKFTILKVLRDQLETPLRKAVARQNQGVENIIRFNQQMRELVNKLARLDSQNNSHKKILELLKQDIMLLAKIREHLHKQIELFNLVSLSVEVALNQTLSSFLDDATLAEQVAGQFEVSNRMFFLNILQEQAVEINKEAYFLYTLSSAYFDVSTRFLINRFADLPQVLATSNDADRQRLLITLKNQTIEAQEAIKVIAQRKREDYPRLMDARKRELQDIFDRLGSLNETTTMAIQMGSATQL